MEETRLPPTQPPSGSNSLEEPADSMPVSSYAFQKSYPIESLEVHGQNTSTLPMSASYAPTLRSVPFSRRKATIVSLTITFLVLLLTGVSTAFLVNRSDQDPSPNRSSIPTQDVSLTTATPAAVPPELQGTEEALLVNGDIITRGVLRVAANTFVATLSTAALTANQSVALPNASGTLCLDVNNCNYASVTQLNQQAALILQLQTQLGQIVLPDVSLGVTTLNEQNGAVTIQGSINRIAVTTNNGVITISTPQDLDANADVQFGNLTLATTGTLTANVMQQTAAGNDIALNAGNDEIIFSANGRNYEFPASGGAAQTICTTTGNCGGGGGSVTDVNGENGSITLQGTANQISVNTGSGTITFSTPQNINTTSTPTFAGLTLTAPLGISSGGTGTNTAPTNGQLLIGNGAGYNLSTLTNGGGVTITNGSGTITLGVAYGSGVNTAVQGSTILTCPGGVGNLGGGGNNITLGAGGACNSINIVNNPTFSTSVTSPLFVLTGAGSNGTLSVANLNQTTSYTLPDPGQATADICLSTGNCVGGAGGAPNNATYLAVSLDSTLNNERALAAGSNITFTDAGANNNFTIATVQNPSFATSVTSPLFASTGAMAITSGGALTVGSTSQTAVLQGSTTSITSSGVGNDIVITSADQVRLTGFNCTTFANGGALTTDASGNITCADDDGGGAAPTFQSVYDSSNPATFTLNSTNGGLTINDAVTPIGGNLFAVQNNAGSTTYFQVTTSGISVTGSGAFSGDVGVNGGDLTSSGALNITPGGALTVGSAGQTALLQGSSTSITSTGVGNDITLTADDQIILNAGGTIELQDATNVTGNFGATGTGLFQGASVTIGSGAQAGSLILRDGSSNTGTIQTAALGQNTVYTLPDPNSASVDICLSTGNCAGSGGGITGSGTANRIAKFTGTGTIGNSTITDDGTDVSLTGDLTVQGGAAILGATLQAGTIVASDGSSNTGTIQVASLGSNQTYTLPDASGDFCLSSGNCIGGGGGGAPNGAEYLVVSLNGTLSSERALTAGSNITFTDGGANGSFTVATVQNPAFTTSVTTPLLQSTAALAITPGGALTVGATGQTALLQGSVTTITSTGTNNDIVLNSADTIELQDNTNVTGSLAVTGAVTGGTYNGQTISSTASLTGTLNVAGTTTLQSTLSIQGASATIGTPLQQGSIVLHDGDGQTATISVGSALVANTALAIPTTVGVTDTFCLLTIANCTGGSAPASATYLTLGLNGTLTAERVLTAGTNISFTDGGANGNLTVNTVNNPSFSTSVTTPLLTSSGTLTVTPGGAMTVGATGQTALLQGSVTTITSTGTNNDIVLNSADTIELQDNTNIGGTLNVTGATSLSSTLSVSGNVTVAAQQTIRMVGGTTAQRPVSPSEGMMYFDTSTDQLITYANGKWQGDRTTATKIVAASNSTQTAKDAADYIADGTSDEDEINAALTAAAGGKVFLMPGTFTVDGSVMIPDNTTLAGAGRGTVVQAADMAGATLRMIRNSSEDPGTGVVVQDMRLDGRKDLNTDGEQNGIYFINLGNGTAASGAIVMGGRATGLWVENFNTEGIFLWNSDNSVIANNVIQNNSVEDPDLDDDIAGMKVYRFSTNNVISDNIFQGNAGPGLFLEWESSYNAMSGNISQGNGNSGFRIYDNSKNNSLTSNIAQDNAYNGFEFASESVRNTLTGNTTQENNRYGVFLLDIFIVAEGEHGNMVISSNSIADNLLGGIRLEGSDDNTIEGNNLHDNGAATDNNAIVLADDSDYNNVTSNHMTDTSCTTTCYAIYIVDSASSFNELSDNPTDVGTIQNAATSTIFAGQLTNNDFTVGGGSISALFVDDRLRLGAEHLQIANNGVGASPAATNFNPTMSYIEISCSDPDGCTVNLQEGGPARSGEMAIFMNIGTNAATIPDSANVVDGLNTAMGVNDSRSYIYSSNKADNLWLGFASSDN